MANLTAKTTWGNNLSIKTSKYLYLEFALNMQNIKQSTTGNAVERDVCTQANEIKAHLSCFVPNVRVM